MVLRCGPLGGKAPVHFSKRTPEICVLPLSPRRIAIIEDDRDICDSLQELLREHGHTVFCAFDGPQGVALVMAEKPDVACIDLGLPGFDGYEVARRIRAASAQTNIRLIAMSGHINREARAMAHQAGFNDHLVKPFTMAALCAKIADHVRC